MIAWFARHPVAANLLMAALMVGGLAGLFTLKQEVFPEFALETIRVQVDYPGASPREVETSIVKRLEEKLESIEGIEEITSTAAEGYGEVQLKLRRDVSVGVKLDEVKVAVDQIWTFPEEAEAPSIEQLSSRRRVISVALYGDVERSTLRELAYRAKERLQLNPTVSTIEIEGVSDYEVAIEVPNTVLRAYGLSLVDIAQAVRRESLERPGGNLTSRSNETLVRTIGRSRERREFENIVIRGTQEGGIVRLGDIATISDGLVDDKTSFTFNGKPVAFIEVYRTGDERVLDVVAATKAFLRAELKPSLPPGIAVATWRDDSVEFNGRIEILIKNALLGLALILCVLALFLDVRLGFWVAVGIAVSFIGAFGVMAVLGISINQLSLFGFIVAIGIVVDDAIVSGERIFWEAEHGKPPLTAAVDGASRIAMPVIFAVMTTIAAFVPLVFAPGTFGKLLANIPAIVIAVLALSLVESLLILPHHLSHIDPRQPPRSPPMRALWTLRQRFDGWLQWFIRGPLKAGLRFATRRSAITITLGIASVMLSIGLVGGGHIRVVFFPEIEGKYVTANIELPATATQFTTQDVAVSVEEAARSAAARIADDYGIVASEVITAVYRAVGRQSQRRGPGQQVGDLTEQHKASVVVELKDPQDRPFTAAEFENHWRTAAEVSARVRKLDFSSSLVSVAEQFEVEVWAGDSNDLAPAVEVLKARLKGLDGTADVQTDLEEARQELQLKLRPEARSYGVTLERFADQVRAAFFGLEALRVQRGRDEVRVVVRLPESERRSISDLRSYRIHTQSGAFIPLSRVAEIIEGRTTTTITRRDGRRVVKLSARLDAGRLSSGEALSYLRHSVLPELRQTYPTVALATGGQIREQSKLAAGLGLNFALALCAIYALLALPFRSYKQPLIIMSAIPLGIVGALIGHYLMGIDVGLLSVFGLVGLAGIIINDALVLIDFANQQYRSGKNWRSALIIAGQQRFRAILLTTLTTFLGVFPLILETSIQAQFLIPLAVSLGFGLLFGTAILMLFVPAVAMVVGPPPSEREVTAAGPMPRMGEVTAHASQPTPEMHSGNDVALGGYGRS